MPKGYQMVLTLDLEDEKFTYFLNNIKQKWPLCLENQARKIMQHTQTQITTNYQPTKVKINKLAKSIAQFCLHCIYIRINNKVKKISHDIRPISQWLYYVFWFSVFCVFPSALLLIMKKYIFPLAVVQKLLLLTSISLMIYGQFVSCISWAK